MERIIVNAPEKLSPYLSANVLFHFMTEMRFLTTAIEKKALFLRYCREKISYLDLRVGDQVLHEVAYPEKCFCDIPIHDVSTHTTTYGKFGIGLKKSWGIVNGIQPIQYVNPKSNLIRDFQEAFRYAQKVSNDDKDNQTISNYLVSYMLYIKPITGENTNRVSGKNEEKYLTDECEWRYVPDLSEKEMDAILFGNDINKKEDDNIPIIEKYNTALERLEDTWLRFEYSDIKYITVQNYNERDLLISIIDDMKNEASEMEKKQLISKIIVLDDAEEDF